MLAFRKDVLDRAYHLTFFIHPDQGLALDIAQKAMAKLEVASQAQFKRLYYSPTGHQSSKAFRTKVLLEDLHLLQRLIYSESDAVELTQEKEMMGAGVPRNVPREEDMVIRFVKHLVKITLRRNSFYVNLGISRLLHNYTTAETMNLYELLVQDPERVRDDYYYRSRKKLLMRELRKRFGNYLKIVRGFRGEQRFEAMTSPGKLVEIVGEALRRFTPWKSPCVVPERFDPYRGELSELSFHGRDPDDEHRFEINRIHSVLHPDCFQRLVDSLNLGSPREHLTIPQFYMAQGGGSDLPPGGGSTGGAPPAGDPPGDGSDEGPNRTHPLPLGVEETEMVQQYLEDQSRWRKHTPPGLLSIRVDGHEKASLDLLEGDRVNFSLDESAEMIEVCGPNGGLLAVHLLEGDFESPGTRHTSRIILEGGQELSFDLHADAGFDPTAPVLVVEIGYRETRSARAMVLAASRLWRRVKQLGQGLWGEGARFRPPVYAAVFASVLLAGFLFWQLRTGRPGLPTVADVGLQTRGVVHHFSDLPLQAIRKIHVDPLGETPFLTALNQAIEAQVQKSNRFSLSTERQDADAVFKNITDFRETSASQVAIALVNADGKVLWSGTLASDEMTLRPETIAEEIIQNLAAKADQP